MTPMSTLSRVTRGVRVTLQQLTGPRDHVECRHCGTNLPPDAATCPECSHGEPTTITIE